MSELTKRESEMTVDDAVRLIRLLSALAGHLRAKHADCAACRSIIEEFDS